MTISSRGRRGRQQGIGKFEFLVLVAMIGALAAILLDRLVGMEREAERTEVDLTVRNIRVGLRLAVGERLMSGQEDRLAELLEANPVGFLGRLPRGYAEDPGAAAGTGTWRYDPATRILVYRPRQPEAFGNRAELHWQLASQGILGGRIVGIRLESLAN